MNDRAKDEHWAVYKEAALSRLRLLPEISSLAAALLVIATFNSELLQPTHDVKLILTLLLIFIPFSLYMYLSEMNEAAIAAAKALDKYVPGFSKDTLDNSWEFLISNNSFKRKLRIFYPQLVVIIISISVIVFIFHIWKLI